MALLENASQMVSSVAEAESVAPNSVFRTRDSVLQFNQIMDDIKRYSASEFKYVAEAVKIQVMPDNSLIVEMDELEDFMNYNDIDSYVEAVNIVSEANGIEPGYLQLAVDEEFIEEAVAIAEACSKSKKKKGRKCAKCGEDIVNCTCESYTESEEPEIAMFDAMVGVLESCVEAGIPIVLKVNEEVDPSEYYDEESYEEDGYEEVEEDVDLENTYDDDYLNDTLSDVTDEE